MRLGNTAQRMRLFAGLMTLMLAPARALAADYSGLDPTDLQSLERALFLCQWKSGHDVPDSAPIPAVCKSGSVSIEEAQLQDKQWWTFWTRLNSEQALKANQQFSADFAGFQARLKVKPELAQDLLPPGIRLVKDDWRLWLIHKLAQH